MIVSHCENIREFKNFYNEYANECIAPLDFLLGKNYDHTYCFYDEDSGELLGCIYIESDKDNRVCLSGFSKRKVFRKMAKVIEAINWISNFFRKDTLYAYTTKKCAIIVLLRCGFKRYSNNMLIREAF